MTITTDPNDPRLEKYRGKGHDEQPVPQQDVYLALSPEERAKGFVKPLRETYRHVGPPGPRYPLRDLYSDELEQYADIGYVKFERYAEGSAALGRYWTQAQLDAIGKGCGLETRMPIATAETYARDPWFYGGTYCVHCSMHRDLREFVWLDGEPMSPADWPAEEQERIAKLRSESRED